MFYVSNIIYFHNFFGSLIFIYKRNIMPLFYNTGYPTPTSKNTINSVAVGGGIRDFLLNLNLLPQYPQIPTAINGSPKIGQPVLDTTVGTGNVLIPIGLPLETNGIIWKDLNVIYNTFQNDSSLSDVLEEIEFIPAISNPDYGTAIWPTNTQYPIGANTQVEQYGLKGKTEYAEYRKDNVTKNLYLDSTSQIDVADFITLAPLDISQQLGNYADVFGGLNGGSTGEQAINVIGSVLNGQGVGLGAGGSVIPNFDFKSSLLGRVLGGTGFLKDTKLGNVGAQQLSLALANNAAFNVQQEILGTLNLKESIYSLIKDGELAEFRPSYKITVPKSTGGKILNGITRVLGFQIPRSYLDDDGSIFQSENKDAGNINRANSMIENTGKGQVKSLINSMLLNLSVNSETQNSFRSGYAPAFVDKDGTPMSNPKIYAYYYSSGEGTANGDINKILGNVGDVIPSISYDREAETKNSGFESPEEIDSTPGFAGYNSNYNQRKISDVNFSWATSEDGNVNSAVFYTPFEGDKKSLLVKTQKLFNSKGMKTIVSVKGDMNKNSTQTQTANGYGFSKGSAVMSKDMFDSELGVWKGEKNKTAEETYCRSWTTLNRYDSITNLIRHKPLNENAPYRHKTQGSVLDGPFVKIGPYANDTSEDPKKFMFSIENLAWKDRVGDLPPCEQGPGDLISGEKGRIMWFPPYDIQFSENNTVNWEETNFIGRGEPIYTYNNTKRSGQLSFKIIVDHPSYFNAFNAKRSQEGSPDDNFIASFFAGCVDINETWTNKLNKKVVDSIENKKTIIPQVRQSITNPKEPQTMPVYFPNDVKDYVPTYEDGKFKDGNKIDYKLNPSGFGGGLGTYPADVTQKYVKGVTKTWPDRFDYGLNNGKNSTQPIPRFVEDKTVFGFNDPEYASNMISFLIKYPWAVVNLKGYASKQGNPTSNTTLSDQRAKLLKDKLIVEWGGQLGLPKDKLEKRFIAFKGVVDPSIGCPIESKSNPNPPTDVIGCKLARRVEISVTFSEELKSEYEKALAPLPDNVTNESFNVRTEFINKFYTECDYFEKMVEDKPFVFDSIREKIRYFHPAFHSTTPEGLNSRLTFLLQCTRQGPTLEKQGANNLAFGRPPVCILRIGDFYHTKIVMDNVNISYEPLVWDLNPEGIGVQPMIANVDISFNFLGGSSLMGPINKLQNALSFNYFANTHVYDPRADYISKDRPIWNVKDENGNELPMSMMAPENKETGYYINDGITSYDKYIENLEKIVTKSLNSNGDNTSNQIKNEEAVNSGADNSTPIPTVASDETIINNIILSNYIKFTESLGVITLKLMYNKNGEQLFNLDATKAKVYKGQVYLINEQTKLNLGYVTAKSNGENNGILINSNENPDAAGTVVSPDISKDNDFNATLNLDDKNITTKVNELYIKTGSVLKIEWETNGTSQCNFNNNNGI